MTCTRYASSARETEPVGWLHSASPPGPRSPRTPWRSEGQYGPVISTEANWMPDGSQATDMQRAFHVKHLLALKEALTETVAKLRREHKTTCLAMSQLKAVTHELLAMGGR